MKDGHVRDFTPAMELCISAKKLTQEISDVLEMYLEMFPVLLSRMNFETMLQKTFGSGATNLK